MNGTRSAYGLAILRVTTGVVFITHGWPKLAGGIDQTAGMFNQLGVPLPTVAAWAIALIETLGGLALVLGALVAPAAILLAIHMLVGILLVHVEQGWYVLGAGTGGSEFNVLLIAVLLVLVLAGPGAAAIGGRKKPAL